MFSEMKLWCPGFVGDLHLGLAGLETSLEVCARPAVPQNQSWWKSLTLRFLPCRQLFLSEDIPQSPQPRWPELGLAQLSANCLNMPDD